MIKYVEQMFFANCRYWGALNFPLYNRGSIWAMNTGIESADLNMVWNEKPLAQADIKTIREIKNYFQKARLPFWWWVFPCGQSPLTVEILKDEGFSFITGVPSMLAGLTLPNEEQHDASLQIIQAETKEEISWWEEVSLSGFDFPPETRQQFHKFVDAFKLTPESSQKFIIALWNKKPAAASLLHINNKIAGIYFVSTLAEHRENGIGRALTLATMRFAREAGAQFVTLQSSPDGLRVYQKAGFKEYCRGDVYSLTASM